MDISASMAAASILRAPPRSISCSESFRSSLFSLKTLFYLSLRCFPFLIVDLRRSLSIDYTPLFSCHTPEMSIAPTALPEHMLQIMIINYKHLDIINSQSDQFTMI